MWFSWIPEINMAERISKDHVPYDKWAKDKWIEATPGDVVDYTKVEECILECKKFYKVIELDADRAMAAMLLQRLEQAGILCVDIPQTFASLTDPMNQLEVLMREGKLTHEANPVARWCFGNTSIARNGQGYIKFVKEYKGKTVDRTKRIDLLAAWVNAMARARYHDSGVSVYESRGLTIL
jgi:phage terminase large subunit-like protein